MEHSYLASSPNYDPNAFVHGIDKDIETAY